LTKYLHGTAPEEQRRLSLLNEQLNDASLREAALAGGERVLDVGCGLAQLTRAFARRAGRPVLGIERSAEQIAQAKAQATDAGEGDLVELRQGDAESLPLRDDEWGRFDVVHARFLLEHVRDPVAVTRAMVRAARPGGRIILEDDDHELLRLWPEPQHVRAVWEAYIRTFEKNGNDSVVGRKLAALLDEAGAAALRSTLIFFGGCAGMATLAVFVDNLIGLIEGMRKDMVAHGLVGETRIDEAVSALHAWKGRPDAAFWYAVPWVEGIRRD
jgi:SAM-dependent methyltransferase